MKGEKRKEKSETKIEGAESLWDILLKFAKAVCYAVLAIVIGGVFTLVVCKLAMDEARRNFSSLAEITPTYQPKIDWARLPKWTIAANPQFLSDVVQEADKFETSAFDKFALGMHERDNGSIMKAYYYLSLASAQAHPYARQIRDQIAISAQDEAAATDRFIQALTLGGDKANFLLGMLYLGDKAFELARRPDVSRCDYYSPQIEPTWPPCERNFQLNGAAELAWPNDLLAERLSDNQAYLAFARATQCFHQEAQLWLNAMEKKGWVDQVTAQALRAQASNQVQNGGKREQFCNGNVWYVQGPGADERPSASVDPAGYCSLAAGDGLSKAQRDRPGRSGYDPADDAAEAPLCNATNPNNPYCDDSAAALQAADEARVCLRMGDAMLAAGDVDYALQYYRASIARGRKYGAQASVVAGDRLRALSLTCEYTTASLARIARGAKGSDFINIVDRQRALKALGYYSGRVDGSWGEQTRESVRNFQREVGFDETGALSPLETVVLICQAAENKSDSDAQNLLGVMYAAGLGVVQNTDLALQWLNAAARRGNADAYYNLAIIYATGTILSSYRLCDARFNDDMAAAFFKDAQRLGHKRAQNETFEAFKTRIVAERNTHLEVVTPSCGPEQANQDAGQNK
ncbi:MAG: peptidoglycan-binding protein [Pseudomonadota bacterium]